MTNKKTVFAAGGVVLAGLLWWAFRPELLFVDASVHESFAAGRAKPLASGTFHGVAHETAGTATLYQTEQGKRVLRLTGFKTSNGPDVNVYLGKAPDATDNDTVTRAGFFHVGKLKGNVGDQNYQLPDTLALGEYRSVTIWCRRFGVNFGTAPLTPAGD